MTKKPIACNSGQEIKRGYSLWRLRIMFALILGYAFLYMTRTNLSFAVPGIQQDLGYSKEQLGIAFSVAGVVYGVGRFFNGILVDRCSSRLFFSIGIALSALTNICLGFVTNLPTLTVLWGINSFFQSMGAPACARMLTHWYSPKQIGTQWALWSTSQQMGYFTLSLALPICLSYWSWHWALWFPGALTLIVAIVVYLTARDEPADVYLPGLETYENVTPDVEDQYAHLSSFQIFSQFILRNTIVWAMCLACFFVYFVRFTYYHWGPTFLIEAKGCTLKDAGNLLAIFHIASAAGGFLAGFWSDRLFKGYRGRVGLLFSLGLAVGLFAVWLMPAGKPWLHKAAMFVTGFFLTGPLTMISVAAVDFASKKASGTASGITGIFGYIGVTFAGYGPAKIAEHTRNWDLVFIYMLLAALAATACFLFTWNARATYHKTHVDGDTPENADKAA